MKLFEEKKRTDFKPAKFNDSTFDFLDRSSSEKASIVRKVLNSWFENYPEAEKLEFKKRFPKEFSSALYELFIYNLFWNQGFQLECHPTLPDSTQKPDFLAKGNGLEFYIEAKEATDKSDSERALERKTNQIYDILNTTNSPNFYLKIKALKFQSEDQPSAKKIVRYLERKLPENDPDIAKGIYEKLGYNALPIINYEDHNLKMEIILLPKSPETRNKENVRPIGVLPSKGFIGGSDEPIKSALEKKAKKYGELDKPLLLCINSLSEKGTDEIDILDALFGSTCVTYSTDPNNINPRLERANNGFFRDSKGPKFTKISAVLINKMNLGHIKDGKYWLVKHPFATKELKLDSFSLKCTVIENNKITSKSGYSLKEIMKLEKFEGIF